MFSTKTLAIWLMLNCGQLVAREGLNDGANAAIWTAYAQAQGFAAADFVAVSKLSDSWAGSYTPSSGRNHALSSLLIETGVVKGAWKLGFEKRSESAFSANKDSLDLYYLYKQKERPSHAIGFNLQAQAKSWKSDGLAISYRVYGADAANASRSDGVLDLKLSVFLPSNVRQSDLSGTAHYSPNNTLAFAAQYANQASNYQFPFMAATDSRVLGLSLSASGHVKIVPQTQMIWSVRDAFSAIKIAQMPGYIRNYTSATSSLDTQGYINYAPTMTGQNKQNPYRSKLSPTLNVQLNHQYGDDAGGGGVAMFAGLTHTSNILMPVVGAVNRMGAVPTSISYNTRFKAVTVQLQANDWHIGLTTDRLNIAKAHTLGLSAAYSKSF